MLDKVKDLIEEVKKFQTSSHEEIENFRIEYLGKKGVLNDLFAEFKNVEPQLKKEFGQALNTLKVSATEKVNQLKDQLDSNDEGSSFGDLTRPSEPIELGARHPISIVRNQIIEIFSKIGFTVSEGPEIEDDWHNFTALNLPEYHPARDMQDTFFIEQNPDILLRTHTSSVQTRYMETHKPPIRTLSPGRVFRNEDISARAHCIFHQVEGLYIDKDVSFADLKQTLLYFTKEMFGKSKIRLRPSYFPFTEPSAEVDIYWGLETETDYRITKGTGWLEIMGCGMVDPNVLKNANIDPNEYSGYAFGMGIERIAMLLYQIPDIRMFYENDMRFLKQFKSAL
ncbi:MAG: phenylalanine--tRNA ligase subunit alpha [Flavobacteriaceae bacterium]